MMKRDWPILFSDHDLQRVLEHQLQKVTDVVRRIKENDFDTSTDDFLATATASQLVISPLELLEEETYVSRRDVQVDVSHDRNRHFSTPGPHYMDGVEVTYHLPYLGDPTLLKCRPNISTPLTPRAIITNTQMRFPYDRVNRSDIASTEDDFRSDVAAIRDWVGWINQQVMTYNTSLKAQALALVRQRREEIARTNAAIANLSYPMRKDRISKAPTETIARRLQRRKEADREYDVALSYASENREYVEKVAKILDRTGVSVFYDRFEIVSLWGKDLAEHLHHIYSAGSHFVVMFASRHYAKKAWPSRERQSALSRHFKGEKDRILPVKHDDTEIPGVPSTIGYIDARHVTPEELAELICQKLDA